MLKTCVASKDSVSEELVHPKNDRIPRIHYSDVIISTMASQITSLTIVYSTVYSGADERKHQSSASLAFFVCVCVCVGGGGGGGGVHRSSVNSPHKGPATRKKFPFDDVIMHCIPVIMHMVPAFFFVLLFGYDCCLRVNSRITSLALANYMIAPVPVKQH